MAGEETRGIEDTRRQARGANLRTVADMAGLRQQQRLSIDQMSDKEIYPDCSYGSMGIMDEIILKEW